MGKTRETVELVAGTLWLAPARFTMLALSTPWLVTYQAARLVDHVRRSKEAR